MLYASSVRRCSRLAAAIGLGPGGSCATAWFGTLRAPVGARSGWRSTKTKQARRTCATFSSSRMHARVCARISAACQKLPSNFAEPLRDRHCTGGPPAAFLREFEGTREWRRPMCLELLLSCSGPLVFRCTCLRLHLIWGEMLRPRAAHTVGACGCCHDTAGLCEIRLVASALIVHALRQTV